MGPGFEDPVTTEYGFLEDLIEGLFHMLTFGLFREEEKHDVPDVRKTD